MEMKCQKVYIF